MIEPEREPEKPGRGDDQDEKEAPAPRSRSDQTRRDHPARFERAIPDPDRLERRDRPHKPRED